MKLYLENNINCKLNSCGEMGFKHLQVISPIRIEEIKFDIIDGSECLLITTNKPAGISGSWIVQEL